MSHRGNEKLRNVGQVIEMTDEMIKEYIRCKEDLIYFCEKYFHSRYEAGQFSKTNYSLCITGMSKTKLWMLQLDGNMPRVGWKFEYVLLL